MDNLANQKELVDQRKHMRFRVREGAFAVLKPHFTIVGEIIDVSKGGLGFRYITGDEHSSESSELNILFADGNFCLRHVLFKTISDFVMSNEFSSGSITTKRRGIQFGELTLGQTSALEYFIQNYTTGEA